MSESKLQISDTYQKWRKIKDQLAQYGVVAGGLGVIVAIVLIFFYLMYVVYPLFVAAEAHSISQYSLPEPEAGKTLYLTSEEQNEVAVRFTDQGNAVFFSVNSGKVLKTFSLGIPAGIHITSFAVGTPSRGHVIYGLSNGQVIVAKHQYRITYPNDQRVITPHIKFPLGEQAIQLDASGVAIAQVAIRASENETTIVGQTVDQRILLTNFAKEDSLFADEGDFERHFDYIHYNPVRHRYASRPADWAWSSFGLYVQRGVLTSDWGATEIRIPETVGRE